MAEPRVPDEQLVRSLVERALVAAETGTPAGPGAPVSPLPTPIPVATGTATSISTARRMPWAKR